MLLTEYNEVETMKLFERDGWRKGREKGIKEGIKEGREKGIKEGREKGIKEGREKGIKEGIKEERIRLLIELVSNNLISIQEAAKRLELTEEQVQQMIDQQHNT